MAIAADIDAVIASIDALEVQNDQSRYARQNLVWSSEAMATYEADPPEPLPEPEVEAAEAPKKTAKKAPAKKGK